jgi:hypothetical protein
MGMGVVEEGSGCVVPITADIENAAAEVAYMAQPHDLDSQEGLERAVRCAQKRWPAIATALGVGAKAAAEAAAGGSSGPDIASCSVAFRLSQVDMAAGGGSSALAAGMAVFRAGGLYVSGVVATGVLGPDGQVNMPV